MDNRHGMKDMYHLETRRLPHLAAVLWGIADLANLCSLFGIRRMIRVWLLIPVEVAGGAQSRLNARDVYFCNLLSKSTMVD